MTPLSNPPPPGKLALTLLVTAIFAVVVLADSVVSSRPFWLFTIPGRRRLSFAAAVVVVGWFAAHYAFIWWWFLAAA